jgi:hypothetical protein
LAQARKFKWSTVIGLSISAVEVGSVCFLSTTTTTTTQTNDRKRVRGVREGVGESVSRWDRR